MPAPAIHVQSLSKEYTVGADQQVGGTLYDYLGGMFRRSGRNGTRARRAPFWALREVNFEIARGEVFGIVGRNGAGKSTLLKILSRITAPTQGRVTVAGRVASLLEVGTGFHPELTGRENIYLNATILGMRRAEIDAKLDAIVAFSGVERFLHTPVKRYSSGMYVRLAFAVAAHVDADVLLIDEVLAVGDADFQKRCLGIMGDVARTGRTVLFVSHNLTAMRNLCTTGLLLAGGEVQAQGKIGMVLEQYASTSGAAGTRSVVLAHRNGTGSARVVQVSVLQGAEDASAPINAELSFDIGIRVQVLELGAEVSAFISCFDAATQTRVFSTGSFFSTELHKAPTEVGTHEYVCSVPAHLLNEGDYTLDVVLLRNRSEVLVEEPAVLSFRVVLTSVGIEGWNWPVLGVVRPKVDWTHRLLDESPHAA